MGKISFSKGLILAPILGVILVQVAKNWDKLPFNTHVKMIDHISVPFAEYDTSKKVLNIRIANTNYFDVSDIKLSCSFNGASGTRIGVEALVIYSTVFGNGEMSAQEKIENMSIQAKTVLCAVEDAKEMSTKDGNALPDPDSIKLQSTSSPANASISTKSMPAPKKLSDEEAAAIMAKLLKEHSSD